MTQLSKIFSLISALIIAIGIGLIENSFGIGLITFCVVLTLSIAMALTAENL